MMKIKNILIAFTVALSGFAPAVQATPKDNTWYAAGKLGWSQYHDTNSYNNVYANHIDNNPIRHGQFGLGTFLGYQANPHLGFELGYDWLGRMIYKSRMNSGAFKAQGISVTAKLSYPLNDDLDIYTRLGSMAWRSNLKGIYDDNENTGRINHNDSGISPMASVGLEHTWNKNWATRLDYQWVNNVGDAGTMCTHLNNSIVSLGISYRFNQGEAASLNSDSVIQTKHFSLKSDVLFNFNKATLKSDSQQVIDQLYSQLSSMNLKDSSTFVLGYTDRIGSDTYNKKLSQVRAKNVVNYLVSKGVPAKKISVRGMGKSNPVTGSACKSMKGRAVINCLAPDRRVEIEVKGIKDAVIHP